ncbi:MAG: hypothetical protein LQ348_007770 [Seirophora lacunosa]|nr:MAG: hypothetical protein LQ348_007770 [Seirophora lacunosa]
MAELPKTPTPSVPSANPSKRARIDHLGFEDSAVQLDPSENVASSTISKETPNNNTRNQCLALEKHMMFLDKKGARQRNQEFFEGVLEILSGDRSSATSQRTLTKIQDTQDANRFAMESTYVTAVFPTIIGDSRTVNAEIPDPEMLTQVSSVLREFAQDRLHWEGPCYFVKDLLCGPRTKKDFGISDPRPDLAFGIRREEMDMNPPRVSNATEIRIRAAGCLDHCFCIFEAKGPDEPFAQAIIQGIRGGATLVRARRWLNEQAGRESSKIGADPDSWVFVVAWMHGYAEVYVSWHETLPAGEADHMHFLDSYALKRPSDIQRFQRDLHNILDWGLDHQRVVNLEQMMKEIAEREAAGEAA